MRIPLIYKAQVIAANTYANTHRPQTPQIVGRDAAGHGHHHGGGGDLPLALRGVGHPSAAERLQPPHPHIMPRVRLFLTPTYLKKVFNHRYIDKISMRGAGQGECIITIYGISRYTPISHAGNRPDIRNYLPLNPTKTGTVINSRIPHIDNQ